MVYLYPTNDAYNLSEVLPPTLPIDYQNEHKNRFRNKVFLTTSMMTAVVLAAEFAKQYGGRPKIYIVKPDPDSLEVFDGNEYICNYAKVVGIYM